METLLHIVQPLTSTFPTTSWWSFWWGRGSFSPFAPALSRSAALGRACAGFSAASPCAGAGRRAASSFQALTTAIAAPGGHRQYHRLLQRHPGGGARCHLLDVDHRFFRDVHHLRRGRSGPGDPGGPCGRHRLRRPVYYIKRAFQNKFGTFLAGFFAVAITLALGFIGCMVQSNSIGQTCGNAFGIPPWIIGAVVAVASAFVFLGGVQRVASVTEKLVPIMAASIWWALW